MAIVRLGGDEASADGRDGSSSLPRFMVFAGLACMLIVLASVAIVSYDQWRRVVDITSERIASQSYFLADHAARTFEAADLAAQRVSGIVEDVVRYRDGDVSSLADTLRGIAVELPYVDDVWVEDAEGRVVAGARRGAVSRLVVPTSSVVLSSTEASVLRSDDGERTLQIRRSLVPAGGSSIGTAVVSISPEYFDRFWAGVAMSPGTQVMMIRDEDHLVLAAHPGLDHGMATGVERLPEEVHALDDPGEFAFVDVQSGLEKEGAYRRVGTFPVFLHVSVERRRMLDAWLEGSTPYFIFATAALLSLFCLTAFSRHQANRSVHDNRRLKLEVARRTKSLVEETRALETLLRTSRRLSGQRSEEEIAELVVSGGRLMVGALHGLYAPVGSAAKIRARGGILVPEEGGFVLRDGFVSELMSFAIASKVSTRHRPSDGHGAAGGGDDREWLIAPVVLGSGTVHGVLLFCKDRSEIFTEKDERLLDGLATQAAVALESATMFARLRSENDARKQSEERARLLAREMHHRVKNSLATVRAIANLTARSSTDVESYARSFSQRLNAMAQTHTMLTEAPGQTATITDLLHQEVGPYCAPGVNEFYFDGPGIELEEMKAVSLGMAFHELATNAVKYGALSVPGGRIVVRWELHARGDERYLRIRWQEHDGPIVVLPEKRGFGTTLLQKVLSTQLTASVRSDFAPSGLVCDMEFPVSSIGAGSQKLDGREQAA